MNLIIHKIYISNSYNRNYLNTAIARLKSRVGSFLSIYCLFHWLVSMLLLEWIEWGSMMLLFYLLKRSCIFPLNIKNKEKQDTNLTTQTNKKNKTNTGCLPRSA